MSHSSNLILENFECQDNITGTTSSSTSSSPLTTEARSGESDTFTVVALGALVGLLTVLLTLAIIGWVCTFMILKKKGTANINKTI